VEREYSLGVKRPGAAPHPDLYRLLTPQAVAEVCRVLLEHAGHEIEELSIQVRPVVRPPPGA
jgi:hypothetical protein